MAKIKNIGNNYYCPNFKIRQLLETKKSFLRKYLSKEIYKKLSNLESEYNKNIYNLK